LTSIRINSTRHCVRLKLLIFIEYLPPLVLVESRSHTNARGRIPATQAIKDRARPNGKRQRPTLYVSLAQSG
jgi:hypothetical protein